MTGRLHQQGGIVFFGLAHLRAGNTHQARAALSEATNADPRLSEAWLLGADLDIRLGATAPAIDALQKLITRELREIRAHLHEVRRGA